MEKSEEEAWVEKIRDLLNNYFSNGASHKHGLHAEVQVKLPYELMLPEFKIVKKTENVSALIPYDKSKDESEEEKGKKNENERTENSFATDLLIYEDAPGNEGKVIPRVVVEAKFKKFNTHDPIVYGKKAAAHKGLFPALRDGCMIGANESKSLTWRLFEHGKDFDFIFSFSSKEPDKDEKTKLKEFYDLVDDEVTSSRELEQIFKAKSKPLDIYCVHRNLKLSKNTTKK